MSEEVGVCIAHGNVYFTPWNGRLPAPASGLALSSEETPPSSSFFPLAVRSWKQALSRDNIGFGQVVTAPAASRLRPRQYITVIRRAEDNTFYVVSTNRRALAAIYKNHLIKNVHKDTWPSILQFVFQNPANNNVSSDESRPFFLDPALAPESSGYCGADDDGDDAAAAAHTETPTDTERHVSLTVNNMSMHPSLHPTMDELRAFLGDQARMQRVQRAAYVDSQLTFPTPTGRFTLLVDDDVRIVMYAFLMVGQIPTLARREADALVAEYGDNDAVSLFDAAAAAPMHVLTPEMVNRLTVCLWIVEMMQGLQLIPALRPLHMENSVEARCVQFMRSVAAYNACPPAERAQHHALARRILARLAPVADRAEAVAREMVPHFGAYLPKAPATPGPNDTPCDESEDTDVAWFYVLNTLTMLTGAERERALLRVAQLRVHAHPVAPLPVFNEHALRPDPDALRCLNVVLGTPALADAARARMGAATAASGNNWFALRAHPQVWKGMCSLLDTTYGSGSEVDDAKAYAREPHATLLVSYIADAMKQ